MMIALEQEPCPKCGRHEWKFDVRTDSEGKPIGGLLMCECFRCGTKVSIDTGTAVPEESDLKCAS